MAWILGMGRLSGSAPVLAACVLLAASGCSTDVEYLRAGRVPAGSVGGAGLAGAGGGDMGAGGAAGSPIDDGGFGGGAETDADDGATDAGGGGGGAGGGTGDAEAEAGPRPPIGVMVGVSMPSDSVSPSIGGMNYTDLCAAADGGVPGSGVVIGVKGTVDPPGTGLTYLKSVAVVCGTLGIKGGGPVEVTTLPGAPQPVRGSLPGTVMQEGTCPPNQVVVGFDSRAAMYIDQLTFRCAPVTVAAGPQGYALSIGMSKPIGSVGGSGGNLQSPISCPSGSVVVGSVLRAGNAIDAFGFACAPLSLAFAP